MALPPPPPNPGSTSSFGNNFEYFPRRPLIWVPPVLVGAGVAAGYGIPWDLGNNLAFSYSFVVIPLLLTAISCSVAAFYAYRTTPGWRTWTWISFSLMFLCVLNFTFIAQAALPNLAIFFLFVSSAGLAIAGAFGAEEPKIKHQLPGAGTPGYGGSL